MGFTSCYEFKHIFHHIPGVIFAHVPIYLGQLMRFFVMAAQNCHFLGFQMVNPFYIVTICSDYCFLKHISFWKESKGFWKRYSIKLTLLVRFFVIAAQNSHFLGSLMVNPFYIVTICSDYCFLKHISFWKESKGFLKSYSKKLTFLAIYSAHFNVNYRVCGVCNFLMRWWNLIIFGK